MQETLESPVPVPRAARTTPFNQPQGADCLEYLGRAGEEMKIYAVLLLCGLCISFIKSFTHIGVYYPTYPWHNYLASIVEGILIVPLCGRVLGWW